MTSEARKWGGVLQRQHPSVDCLIAVRGAAQDLLLLAMSFSTMRPQSRSLSQPSCEVETSATVCRTRSFRYTDFWNELVAAFKLEIQPGRHRRLLRVYDDCFEARYAVTSLLKVLQTKSERELTATNALRLFRKFQEMNVVEDAQSARNKAPLDDEDSIRLFRFVQPVTNAGIEKENVEREGKLGATPHSRCLKAESEYQLAPTGSTDRLVTPTSRKFTDRFSEVMASGDEFAVPKCVPPANDAVKVSGKFHETPRRVPEPKVLREFQAANQPLNHYPTVATTRPTASVVDRTSENRFMMALQAENRLESERSLQINEPPATTPFRDAVLGRLRVLVGDRFGFGAFATTVNDANVRHNCTHTTRCGLVTELPREALYPDWLLTTMRTLTAAAPASRRSNTDTTSTSSLEQFRGLESDCFSAVVRYVADEDARNGPLVPQSFVAYFSSLLNAHAKRKTMRDDIDLSAPKRTSRLHSRHSRHLQLSPIAGSPSVEGPHDARRGSPQEADGEEDSGDADLDRLVDVLRYALLTLLPANRRKLYVLARFMNKLISFDEMNEVAEMEGDTKCRLDPTRSNRQVVESSLSQPVLGTHTDSHYLLRFISDNYRSVFVVPTDLRALALVPPADSSTSVTSLSTVQSECSVASRFTSTDTSLQRPIRLKPPIAPKPRVKTESRDNSLSTKGPVIALAPHNVNLLPLTATPTVSVPPITDQLPSFPQYALSNDIATIRLRTPRRAESLTQYDRVARRTYYEPAPPVQSSADVRVGDADRYDVQFAQSQSALMLANRGSQPNLNCPTSQGHPNVNGITPPSSATTANHNQSGRSSGRTPHMSRRTEEELTRLIDYVYKNEKGELSRGEREKRLKQFSQVYPQLYARYRGFDEQLFADVAGHSHTLTPKGLSTHRRASGLGSFFSKLSQTFLNK